MTTTRDPLDTATETVISCTWCRTMLAAGDAKPIKHARLPDAPDEENMQCADEAACDRRQDALDAALTVRAREHGGKFLFIKTTPGVLEALEDGERLREAMAALERDHRG